MNTKCVSRSVLCIMPIHPAQPAVGGPQGHSTHNASPTSPQTIIKKISECDDLPDLDPSTDSIAVRAVGWSAYLVAGSHLWKIVVGKSCSTLAKARFGDVSTVGAARERLLHWLQ